MIPSKVEVIQGEEMIGSNPTFLSRTHLVLKSKGGAYHPKYVMGWHTLMLSHMI